MNIIIRRVLESDHSFILSSMMKSLRNHEMFKDMNNSNYYNFFESLIKAKIKSNHCLVACNAEDAWQVYGYIISNELGPAIAIDFVYVKELYREMKICSALLSKANPNSLPVFNSIKAESIRQKNICKKMKAQLNVFLLTNK